MEPVEYFRQIDKKRWKKWLFYLDLVMIAIFIFALVMLVRDTYFSGYYLALMEQDMHDFHLWGVVRDAVFAAFSGAYIFVRFFVNLFAAMRNPWA
ncbi:MAG: hypothetical protein CVT48_00540 [Thermoplasmata archaeon HGW-Thermoplasmata-1]|nr:MAG: hypothetical protein CVT48_00540 [Thermoplasmata archaeon HGW-Thermoplasmata-1]